MSPVKFVKEGRSNAASVKQEKNPPISELLKMEPNTNVSSATLPGKNVVVCKLEIDQQF